MRAFENNPPGFEHISVVARFQSFRHTLLYEKQRDAVLAHSSTPRGPASDRIAKTTVVLAG
jgi:hypothetical protein